MPSHQVGIAANRRNGIAQLQARDAECATPIIQAIDETNINPYGQMTSTDAARCQFHVSSQCSELTTRCACNSDARWSLKVLPTIFCLLPYGTLSMVYAPLLALREKKSATCTEPYRK